MTDANVIDQMRAAGLELPPLPLDLGGTLRRFGPKKAHWYLLREQRTEGGRPVVVGTFGCWKLGQTFRVEVDWRQITAEERAELERKRQAQAQAAQQAREQLAAQAAMDGAQLWAAAARQGRSAYLARKAVDAEGCRYLQDGSIVIPLLRYDRPRDQALQGLQVIRADGSKRFTRGLAKTGACLRLGHVVVGEPILLCEGYATALSVRMALERRFPVFVAVDAGNLQPVAELLRSLHDEPIVICADDDWQTVGNPGRHKAHLCARDVIDCGYLWPQFKGATRGPKDTDFNDLHLREGLGAVRRQLLNALTLVGSSIATAHAA